MAIDADRPGLHAARQVFGALRRVMRAARSAGVDVSQPE